MLGMVFTEFIEMVEQRFSSDMADDILNDVPTAHGGAYTAVGDYPHQELVALVTALSRRTELPLGELVRAFGRHLCGRFVLLYPAMFQRHAHLFDFAAAIDNEIHVEVRKLYPNALLPRFTVLSRRGREMTVLYESPRRMEALALGLLDGLALFYRQPCRITVEPADDGQGTVFHLALQSA